MKKAVIFIFAIFASNYALCENPKYFISLYEVLQGSDYTPCNGYIVMSESREYKTGICYNPITKYTNDETLYQKSEFLTGDDCVFYQTGKGRHTGRQYRITIKELEIYGLGDWETIVRVEVKISNFSDYITLDFKGYMREI